MLTDFQIQSDKIYGRSGVGHIKVRDDSAQSLLHGKWLLDYLLWSVQLLDLCTGRAAREPGLKIHPTSRARLVLKFAGPHKLTVCPILFHGTFNSQSRKSKLTYQRSVS